MPQTKCTGRDAFLIRNQQLGGSSPLTGTSQDEASGSSKIIPLEL
jgi:hypothetical protein